ncbi:MAG: ribosome maturation factor RimP [Clostridia bacterium]|nr:ribosome maturation factor RimP [Clostridia bacterium]
MKVKPISEINAVAEKVAEDTGVEFIEAVFRTGSSPSLTVFVDTEDGVDLDTLEKFHRAFDVAIDELDPTYGAAYTLNVSSPGLDRPLKTPRDFERALGQEVEVKLFAPVKGVKFFEGVLSGYDDNTVTLETEKEAALKFEKSKIAKINLAIKFD